MNKEKRNGSNYPAPPPSFLSPANITPTPLIQPAQPAAKFILLLASVWTTELSSIPSQNHYPLARLSAAGTYPSAEKTKFAQGARYSSKFLRKKVSSSSELSTRSRDSSGTLAYV